MRIILVATGWNGYSKQSINILLYIVLLYISVIQATNSKPKPEKAEKKPDQNGCEKKNMATEVYNQNNIPNEDATSDSYKEIIKYFRYCWVIV